MSQIGPVQLIAIGSRPDAKLEEQKILRLFDRVDGSLGGLPADRVLSR